ncbi:MAG: TerC family protein [Actinobacteria bacterium]|nr:TerC family protein [Actinomycetota bacterium]
MQPWQWALFLALVAGLLVADLLVVHRDARPISFREAAVESAVWIGLGLSFALVVLWWQGGQAAGEYVTGYLIEESLSIDNVFVWAVILSWFAVPAAYQFRTLFWGIFGALVLRAAFIFAGVALINRFDVMLLIFGFVLIYSAWKIAFGADESVDPDRSLALRAVRRVVPSTTSYDGHKLFTRENARRVATPLFAVLIMIETTDLVFAVDSIPAILAVAREQFIVFSSNAFAILGLRSLYFCVNGMQDRFRYLNVGLGVVLAFVGVKMLGGFFFEEWFRAHVPTWSSLAVITAVLAVTVALSLRADRRDEQARAAGHPHADPVDGRT